MDGRWSASKKIDSEECTIFTISYDAFMLSGLAEGLVDILGGKLDNVVPLAMHDVSDATLAAVIEWLEHNRNDGKYHYSSSSPSSPVSSLSSLFSTSSSSLPDGSDSTYQGDEDGYDNGTVRITIWDWSLFLGRVVADE